VKGKYIVAGTNFINHFLSHGAGDRRKCAERPVVQRGNRHERRALLTEGISGESSTMVYGIHAVETLLATRQDSIDHIYFDKTKRSQPLFNLMKQCRKERLTYNLVPPLRLLQITGTENHQGIAAVCSVKPYGTIESLEKTLAGKKAPLLILAASIEDPGNLGALIRSCVAFNVDALFLERKNTAPLSPVVAKCSAGTVEHLTILRPKNLEGIVESFHARGFRIIGAHAKKGVPPDTIDCTGPTMIIIGGEHRGIPPYLEKLCTGFATIPQSELAQSLNASVAGAVMLYECNRQRRNSP
jgi:23S rRNA (guanosine2251-2'-O)-methyltransferase